MSEDAQLKRMRWRCRRGTKELDILFGWWLDECWPHASAAQRQAFDQLLDAGDPDLWDWAVGRGTAPREDWQAIVDTIRTHHHL